MLFPLFLWGFYGRGVLLAFRMSIHMMVHWMCHDTNEYLSTVCLIKAYLCAQMT